ncbi:MAG: lipoyl(octanoyl) transferase LipB [Burkholderiales bacterium]|nr:lipoyl(octanoyl) transferase LipB [Burkholderiales bacterium]
MLIRTLGRVDYQATWEAMRAFTDARSKDTEDELWIVEHDPVFTQGIAGKAEHLLLNPEQIPVVQTDRGGQITYHGPGQAMVYVLLDLRRAGYGVRELVQRIENAVIAVLAAHGVEGYGKRDAPGVYVRRREGEAKIASLGLKVRNGCTYHGVAFNVAMDLAPFACINPCGYSGLAVTQLSALAAGADTATVARTLADALTLSLTALAAS